jgi:ribosomal protein S18 acetylase RimI-like enzyme
MSSLVIRQYTAADRDDVRHLHRYVLQLTGAYLGDGVRDEDLDDIEKIYLERGAFLIGEVDRRIVAMGALRPLNDTTAEIKRMRVHPDWQRRGFGSRILTELEAAARQLGYTRLVLDTSTLQLAAQELYQKFGYRETGRGHVADLELIYMEKDVTRCD